MSDAPNQMAQTDAEKRVLDVIKQYTLRSGAQLAQLTDLGPAVLYPALFRLEKAGVIESEWEDMKPPRRRRYRLVRSEVMTEAQNQTAQLFDAILETPDGPVVIGTGFKTLQEAWDAAVCWSGPEHIESEARELHRNYRPLDWITWEQLSKECKDEFRRDARRKLGIRIGSAE